MLQEGPAIVPASSDFVLATWDCFFQTFRTENYLVMEACTKIYTESLFQTSHTGSDSQQEEPGRLLLHTDVRVNPRLQWRHQEVGGARKVEHLLRTPETGRSQPTGKACGLQAARLQGHSSPLELMSHLHIPRITVRKAPGFNASLLGFGLVLV